MIAEKEKNVEARGEEAEVMRGVKGEGEWREIDVWVVAVTGGGRGWTRLVGGSKGASVEGAF